ncbi:pilus assembly protein PilM [Paenibacillus sp. JX-17]|uniref:Pilus assembly protein PilM n=1 Tax=Paenibacillus lacisoli TaxID=3064525 RepID=A0ABT9CF77_9BACL|nr:pilus assembly protein PilM [Paenibacillus sp. JX-17]MDO7906597.1 pilus assembly protein PilM [Paenibacillus sp. JX-17]
MLGIQHSRIGLTIEQTGIRYVKLKNNRAGEVEFCSHLPLKSGMIQENGIADPEALSEALQEWVEREGIRKGNISLSIPPSQMIIRRLTIPAVNRKQVRQLAKLEIENALHLPFEEPVYDYVEIGSDGENTELLVYAAPRAIIVEYILLLDAAGLKVKHVEVSAAALARSVQMLNASDLQETMLIHLDGAMLDIYMFRDGQPVFMRTINMSDFDSSVDYAAAAAEWGMNTSAAAPEKEEKLRHEQLFEMMAEIQRMMNFYQYSLHDGSTRIRELLLTGSPAARRQLQEELRTAMAEVTIQSIDFNQAAAVGAAGMQMNDYRVAWGVAMRHQTGAAVDLYPREDREAKLFPTVSAAALGIWLVLLVAMLMLYMSSRDEGRIKANQLVQLRNDSELLQMQLAERSSAEGAVNRQALLKLLQLYRGDTVAVLDQIMKALPQGGVVRSVSYLHRNELSLTVDFAAMNDSAAYLDKLRRMSFVTGAEIQKLTHNAGAQVQAEPSGAYTAVYRANLGAAGRTSSDTDSGAVPAESSAEDSTTWGTSVEGGQ